ncbi:gastrula zinc finger protein XlCGF17.1-like [Ornithodoros turicata]
MDILQVAKECEVSTSDAKESAEASHGVPDVENGIAVVSKETEISEEDMRLDQDMRLLEPETTVIESSEEGIKPKRNSVHQCSDCGKTFSTSSNMHQHERLCHSVERKLFQCSTCQKLFTTTSNLYQHQRTHTGERPFRCTVCGRAFATSTNLRQHERTHTGEKPFVCTVCAKAFATSTNLRQHHRTHTGEKPFACEECGKAFASSTNLRQHLRSHLRRRLCAPPPPWVALNTVTACLEQALVQGTKLCQETAQTVVVNVIQAPHP